MNFRLKLLAMLSLVVSASAMSSPVPPLLGGVDCNWIGLTESYPIENGVVLDLGNRDSGCDSLGESGSAGIELLPQKRRVLQFLDPALPPEDFYVRIGKSAAATTVLRWQSIALRTSINFAKRGHRALVSERGSFVTLSTQYPFLFLTHFPGPGADPVVRSINVAELYQGEFLQLRISTQMENEKTKITVQGLRTSTSTNSTLMISARLGPVFPEIWQAESPFLPSASTDFRVRLCTAAGLQPSGPCAIPRLEN